MSDDLFRKGGPHHIRRTGRDQYSMSISLPLDDEGRMARKCPDDECSPGYFKVKGGTGITDGQETAYCPYCKKEAEPNDFITKEQHRYIESLVSREAHEGVEKMLKGALGIGNSGRKRIRGDSLSIEMSLRSGSKPIVRRPFEEEVRRDVICSYCGLDQAVYGLATWCADCGEDIFLTHVEAELSVVQSMLGDVERRREQQGPRVAAKDLENCLEDIVSIFEAVLKLLVKRYLRQVRKAEEEIDRIFKEIRNAFQSVKGAQKTFDDQIKLPLFHELSANEVDELARIFEKRKPITHNLGVVDKKHIAEAGTANKEGREVLITTRDIVQAIELVTKTFRSLHNRLFVDGAF